MIWYVILAEVLELHRSNARLEFQVRVFALSAVHAIHIDRSAPTIPMHCTDIPTTCTASLLSCRMSPRSILKSIHKLMSAYQEGDINVVPGLLADIPVPHPEIPPKLLANTHTRAPAAINTHFEYYMLDIQNQKIN